MNDIAGPLIVLALASTVGVVCHVVLRRFWIASAVATIGTAAPWVGGCYALFALTAPSELGPPELIPVLLTVLIALVGVLVAGGAVRAVRAR